MKFRNIFWGMILIVIGLLFTLENLNFIDFDWYNLWRLWPVVLVLWGISIIPVKSIIKVGLVILVLAGAVYYMMQETVVWHDDEYSITYSNDRNSLNQEFIIPFDTVETASLHMEIAASKFELVDESYELIEFEKSGSLVDYKYNVKQLDSTVDVKIFIQDNVSFNSRTQNRVDMSMNPWPVWDLFFEIGAADVNLDLSGIKVKDISIDGGAASIRVKLGDDYPETNLDIETGASSIKVLIPKDSYCELDINAVLSGKNISGFEKIDRGHYKTDNFNQASNRIYVKVETAVSSYSIIRY